MIIAVTGSTGLVGRALIPSLEADGHTVRRVVRRPTDNTRDIQWNPAAGTIDSAGLADIDAVVHLAGESVAAHRWTPKVKQEIRESRVRGTSLLCNTLANMAVKPSTLVSASAIGYYGDRGDERLVESSPPGRGFLADVCQQWEAATQPARDANIRVVNLRIGVVLDRNGGALASMQRPFRLGLGGVIGSGRQYFSWVKLRDLVRIIQFTLNASAVSGPVNATAPQPVTNREFTKTLGAVLRRPTIFPMPAFAARLVFGEMADDLFLGSARVEPAVLSAAGFQFADPELEPALRNLLQSGEQRAES
jgi:uncharacterized protein (TIGR01777 family)